MFKLYIKNIDIAREEAKVYNVFKGPSGKGKAYFHGGRTE